MGTLSVVAVLASSCGGEAPGVAERPAETAAPKPAPARRMWCDARSATPDATLELTIVLPSGRSIDSLSLPLVRCPANATGAPASRCESSESFEPAAWFNGCARLTGANSTEARLQLSLSWSGAESGQCEELATVPLHGSFFKMLPCGVKLAGQLRKPVPATG